MLSKILDKREMQMKFMPRKQYLYVNEKRQKLASLYIDQQTKKIQVSQYNLTLEKNKKWGVIK